MRKLLTAIGLLVIVAAVFYGARASDDDPRTVPEVSPRPGVQGLDAGYRGSKRPDLPSVELSLIDQAGESLTHSDLRGRTTIVAFVPPHCNGECPAVLDQVRGALDLVDNAAEYGVVVIPTSLPSPDDVRRLERWRGLAGRVRVVAGEERGIRAAMREFKLELRESERDLAYVVIVDEQLRQKVAYAAHILAPESLASDLTLISSGR